MEEGNSHASFRVVDLHATKSIKPTKVFARKHLQKFSSNLVTTRLRIAGQHAVVNIYSHNSKRPIIFPNGKNTLVSKELFKTVSSQTLSQ
jgi:hypothetical protein